MSTTDPDATLVCRPATYRKMYYKVHYLADTKNRMIVDCLATTGSQHECTVLEKQLNDQMCNYDLPVKEVIADRGYGRGSTYSALRQKKIKAYISLHEENLGKGKLSRREFQYQR
ncbi:transposase [Kaarinaea lacus]